MYMCIYFMYHYNTRDMKYRYYQWFWSLCLHSRDMHFISSTVPLLYPPRIFLTVVALYVMRGAFVGKISPGDATRVYTYLVQDVVTRLLGGVFLPLSPHEFASSRLGTRNY